MIERCKQCRHEYEVTSEEVASYLCPKCMKPKTKLKVLDSVSLKSLTKVIRSKDDRKHNKTNISLEDQKDGTDDTQAEN